MYLNKRLTCILNTFVVKLVASQNNARGNRFDLAREQNIWIKKHILSVKFRLKYAFEKLYNSDSFEEASKLVIMSSEIILN